MVFLDELTEAISLESTEERRVWAQVSWGQYEQLLRHLGESSAYQVQYLAGILEIVAPSRRHESRETRLGTLLEIYFLESEIAYFPMGSTTLRNPAQQTGAEPDESYCLNADKAIPDLVIEVIVTSGSINRLDLYRRLGVQEVWFWQGEQLTLYVLKEDHPQQFVATAGYEPVSQSALLPKLHLDLLARCVQNPDPLAAAKAFRQGVQARLF